MDLFPTTSCHRPTGAPSESHHFADWCPLLDRSGADHSGCDSSGLGLRNVGGTFVFRADQELADHPARTGWIRDRHGGECEWADPGDLGAVMRMCDTIITSTLYMSSVILYVLRFTFYADGRTQFYNIFFKYILCE